MAKPKRRKATLRSAGVTADGIRERARALAEDPALALPECEGRCVLFSPMKGARRGIWLAHAARDDVPRLEKLASRGNDLARAYAATLLLAHADKIPYVAELRLPGTTAPYVIRGKAKPFQLAGIQNGEDRRLRLLSYMKWVKKRGLHVWSTVDGVVCTGKRRTPPQAFLDAEAEELGLEARGSRYVCEHGGADAGDAMVLGFDGTDATLERCRACLDETTPMLHEVAKHVAAPRVTRLFRLRPSPAPLEGPAPAVDATVPEPILDQYRAGKVKDADLLDAARAARAAAIRARGERVFVAGDRAYTDAESLVAALEPSPAEARALRAGLAAHEGAVVLEKATVARALVELWPKHGVAMLAAAAGGDRSLAHDLHRDVVKPEEAADLVRRADREGARAAGLSGLPTYDRLPPVAAVADAIARAYRAEGQDAAVRVAMERSSAGKSRGVSLAFLEALHAGKGQEWRFAQADREVAAGLAGEVETLLKGDASRYHDALAAVSRASGEVAEFSPRS